MVCDRCKLVVRSELLKLGHPPVSVELGEVELNADLSESQKQVVNSMLNQLGFSLIDDKISLLIERVKTLIIELIQQNNSELKTNLSDFLSTHLNRDYNYISNLFSEVEGRTIENYYIAQKIEKVKELLVYDELSLSEIANLLNYSSVAYLSNQFKKVTGLTPTYFRTLKINKLKSLDQV
jgi:YesN/AraC family two-component response regulator